MQKLLKEKADLQKQVMKLQKDAEGVPRLEAKLKDSQALVRRLQGQTEENKGSAFSSMDTKDQAYKSYLSAYHTMKEKNASPMIPSPTRFVSEDENYDINKQMLVMRNRMHQFIRSYKQQVTTLQKKLKVTTEENHKLKKGRTQSAKKIKI